MERIGQTHRWDMNVLSKQAEHKMEVLVNELAF